LLNSLPAATQPRHNLQDSSQVLNLFNLGSEYLKKDKLDSAEIYFEQAVSLSKKIGFDQGITRTLPNYMRVLLRKGRYRECLPMSQLGLEISKKQGGRAEAVAENNVGLAQWYLGDLDAAADHYLKSLELSVALNDKELERINLNNLSALFLEIKDYEKSVKYAQQGYTLALDIKDTLSIMGSLFNLGIGETYTKHYKVATQHLNECLRLSEAINNPTYVADTYVGLAEIALQQQNYQEALQLLQQGLEQLHIYATSDCEMKIYWGLSISYYHLKSYNQSRHFYFKALALAQQFAAKELSKLYLLGSEIHEKVNDPLKALAYRKQYEALNDSLLSLETQQNIQRLEVEFQTSRKEKEIAQQNLIIANNSLEIQKKNNVIYLSLAALVTLFSALLIIYMLFRNRQKANAEKLAALKQESELKVLMALMEGEEKERSRLARELHDGVGGILSATKMHLSILKNEEAVPERSNKFDHTVSMLDNASQEIRTIAHNLSPDILMRYELDAALENFCQKVSNEKLQVDFYFLGEPLRLKNNFKLIIYRIVQELVNNIIKHAEASHALVQLSLHEQVLSITVEDNGRGFNLTENKGLGLHNLKSRVQDIGGQLNIESSEGNGTTVYLEFDTNPFLEKHIFLSTAV
jgi:signal transduction histidine kinase